VAYANITVLERADGSDLGYRFAVDRRRPPQRGARHATEAELWTIIDESGAITTGGTIVETVEDGKVVDRHIEGGVSRNVSKGDFLFIPEGVPHEVTAFTPEITMMTLEILRPPAANMR
jgi:mannose-6-phosphate isomerase-like protein (cupin superfamily)